LTLNAQFASSIPTKIFEAIIGNVVAIIYF
jgi:hypothetical protein